MENGTVLREYEAAASVLVQPVMKSDDRDVVLWEPKLTTFVGWLAELLLSTIPFQMGNFSVAVETSPPYGRMIVGGGCSARLAHVGGVGNL